MLGQVAPTRRKPTAHPHMMMLHVSTTDAAGQEGQVQEQEAARPQEPASPASQPATATAEQQEPAVAPAASTSEAMQTNGAPPKDKKAWSFNRLVAPEWFALGKVVGWQAAMDKANTQNTTFGLLSVLLITLSFPAFLSAPQFDADENGLAPCGLSADALALAYGVSMYCSYLLAMANIILATSAVMNLQLCADAVAIERYFSLYGYIMPLVYSLFVISVVALGSATFTVLAGRYSLATVVSLGLVTLGLIVLVASVTTRLFMSFALVHLERAQRELASHPWAVLGRMRSFAGNLAQALPEWLRVDSQGPHDSSGRVTSAHLNAIASARLSAVASSRFSTGAPRQPSTVAPSRV